MQRILRRLDNIVRVVGKHLGSVPLFWPVLTFASLALAVAALSYAVTASDEPSALVALLEVFVGHLAVNLLGILIAVLVLDRLYRQRLEQQEKRALIEQMGSPRLEVTDEAVRKLRARGWLTSGVLRNAWLRGANLEGEQLARADLQGADLQGANLSWANLQHANLQNADLQRAILERADLRGARLQGANLQGANLWRANLRYAYLDGARLQNANLQEATMPDGSIHH